MAPRRIRIELDEPAARGLHATLTAALAHLDADQAAAARGVLERLDRRVPEWVAEDPEETVLAALAEAEARGRGSLARAVGAGDRPPRRRGVRAARLRPPPARAARAGGQGLPVERCDGRISERSAAWRALLRDGSVEWTCPKCSRTWLIYLQAYNDDGVPAYRNPVEGDYNRPHWRSER